MNLNDEILSKDQINARFLEAIDAILVTRIALSKSALAEAFGVKPAKFSEILNGRMKAGVDMLAIMCNMFFVSPDWLLMSRGANIFRDSEKLPPIVLTEEVSVAPFLEDKEPENETSHPQKGDNFAIAPLLELIREKDGTIREQAEEIGQLREQLAQARREIEQLKKGKNANTIAQGHTQAAPAVAP